MQAEAEEDAKKAELAQQLQKSLQKRLAKKVKKINQDIEKEFADGYTWVDMRLDADMKLPLLKLYLNAGYDIRDLNDEDFKICWNTKN